MNIDLDIDPSGDQTKIVLIKVQTGSSVWILPAQEWMRPFLLVAAWFLSRWWNCSVKYVTKYSLFYSLWYKSVMGVLHKILKTREICYWSELQSNLVGWEKDWSKKRLKFRIFGLDNCWWVLKNLIISGRISSVSDNFPEDMFPF